MGRNKETELDRRKAVLTFIYFKLNFTTRVLEYRILNIEYRSCHYWLGGGTKSFASVQTNASVLALYHESPKN